VKYTTNQIRQMLVNKNLKVTPQRMAILEAVYGSESHPTADNIISLIRRTNPGIATGTVYKVLDALVETYLIKRVKTDKDSMRYEGITENHHHLYCIDSERIEDYTDRELDHLLGSYFKSKKIPGFQIDEIRLQINGEFKK
jgi:Fur family peroxide stress response transcriptional regulator